MLEMKSYIFPMRIVAKNVKNEGISVFTEEQYSSDMTNLTQELKLIIKKGFFKKILIMLKIMTQKL